MASCTPARITEAIPPLPTSPEVCNQACSRACSQACSQVCSCRSGIFEDGWAKGERPKREPPTELIAHTEFVGVEKARTHSHDATHVAHQKEGRSEARMYAQLRAATLRLAALATLAIPVL